MIMRKKILFLEDDPLLGETLYEDLQDAGYSVKWVKSADVSNKISSRDKR